MKEFVECESCEFVYEAAGGELPEPRNWDACPNCSAETFRFTER